MGDFVLERAQRRLLRSDGTPVDLTPRLYEALLLFVDHAGELLDRDTFMRSVWRGVVVEDNNLSQVVSSLRRILGDDPQNSRYIQTVPRQGFRLVAPVTPMPAPRQAEAGSAPARRRWIAGATAVGIAAASGSVWWTLRRDTDATAGPTLAVLPFKPLSEEGRDELLELGMADSVGTRLSAVPGLVVRSSASVMRYRGNGQDPLRAAKELDVAYVVDGALQRRGDMVRASARLLRASDGTAVWTGSFDEPLGGVFDVQDQISRRVVEALAGTLRWEAGGLAERSEVGGTRSSEAYQLYLAASWRSQDMRSDSSAKAISLLEQALAIDPGYALAWAQLAWVHRRRLWRVDAVPSTVFDAAGKAVDRALAIVPDLAQGRTGLGSTLLMYRFDWEGAEREFRRAIEINRSEAGAHFGLALLSMVRGRVAQGFEHARIARELDPMSPVFHAVEAGFLVEHGRLAEARLRLDRAFDIAPEHGLAHLALGLLHMAARRDQEAVTALRRATDLHDGATRPKAVLAMHLAAIGEVAEARALLEDLRARASTRYVPPTSLATAHAALGNVPAALDALEEGLRVRDVRMVWMKDDPAWAPLRKEARFTALLAQMRLSDYPPGLSAV